MGNKSKGNKPQPQQKATTVTTPETNQQQSTETTTLESTMQAASAAMQEVATLDEKKTAESTAAELEAGGTGEGESNPADAEPGVDEPKTEETTPNSAPAATAQGTKEIKVGAVVDPKQATLGKQASPALINAISQENTSKPVDRSSAFEQKLAKIVEAGNSRERDIALQLSAYVKAMAPGVPLSVEEGVRQQAALFRILRNVVENDDSFKEVFRLTIQFFKEYKNTAFGGAYIHRFHDSLTLSPRDSNALVRLVNLFTVAAGVNQKSDVKRLVNFGATFSEGLSDSARDRVVQYFNT